MKPNAVMYNPDPIYLRELVKLTELSQERCAAALGVSPRQLRYYLSTAGDHQDVPYCVQFALESLAGVDREQVQTRQMVGAIVLAAGGEVKISREHLHKACSIDARLSRWDSPTGLITFRVELPAWA